MAEHPSLVARLVALNERTRQAWKHPHNKKYYVPASFQGFQKSSRETTPLEEYNGRKNHPDDTEPELRIVLDKPPKDMSKGWVFGSDQTACDIYCGEYDEDKKYNIGRQTFSISITKDRHVALKHFRNTNRTEVQYCLQMAGDRRDFVWIMFPSSWCIYVTSANHLKFQVKVAQPSTMSERLRARFLHEVEISMPSMPLPSVASGTTTAESSLVPRPDRKPFYYVRMDHVLGMGSFGKVYVVVDASTGVEYAGKTFIGEIDTREILTLARQNHVSHIFIFTFLTGCVWHFKTTRDELWKSFIFELMVSIGKHPQICILIP